MANKLILITQVSIWDGEVSFENLDVKIDVIEKEFNLPFTVVSGKVHEVSFLVPWSRITSEPIVITINTLGKLFLHFFILTNILLMIVY